jgi:hypothetical protein
LGANALKPPIGKRPDAHTIERSGSLEEIDKRIDNRVVLCVDIDPKIWPRCEEILEEGDGGSSVDSSA